MKDWSVAQEGIQRHEFLGKLSGLSALVISAQRWKNSTKLGHERLGIDPVRDQAYFIAPRCRMCKLR
jgi:hypothetical protein